jgi:hypothetical protein
MRLALTVRAFAVCAALALGLPNAAAQPSAAPAFAQVYPLKPEEGVFAYSRISPSGRYLAYASEMPQRTLLQPFRITQTVTVVDLQTGEILFEEPGIDPYWSLDDERIIYLSYEERGVSLWSRRTGAIARDVAPGSLGDYYSWADDNGRPLILTIDGAFYHLEGDAAVLPAGEVPSCPDIGTGERPLISKDGERVTTFVRGSVVVRSRDSCDFVFDTGLQGAKADFSYDGRYIAFHGPKPDGEGSLIRVVDIQERTVREIGGELAGSSLFPSWTRDGRLSFRYDGPDFRGFMFASNVLSAPARPVEANRPVTLGQRWDDIFAPADRPGEDYALVMIWGAWSAHSPYALRDLQRARADFAGRGLDVAVLTAPEPGTYRADLDRIRAQNQITVPEIPLSPEHFRLTEAANQIPTTLLFRGDELIDRRLGPQTYEDLEDWVGEVTAPD